MQIGTNILTTFIFTVCFTSGITQAAPKELKASDSAPLFKAKIQNGIDFDMSSRKGSWTVLYFYPKAGTPGCTKQACAFRDSIDKIRKQGAEVYGVSSDSVEDQAKFHKEHHLNFSLVADQDGKILDLYGTMMPSKKMSQRWTFIIDPELKIREIEKDVDPALDSEKVASLLSKLKATK